MALELPQLVQRLVLDASGFKRGADEATHAFQTVTRSADNHATQTNQSWLRASQGLSDMGRVGVAVGAGLAAAFGYSIAAAAGFEREMRNVASISKTVQDDFKGISAQVLEMSRTLPQSAKNLASGLYDIVSSGKDGAEAMVVLKASAIAASAGMTTTAVAAKGVSAVLNAYGMSGFEATRVSDILFQTVNKGVLSFEELAGNLGDFVGTAAILKVPIEDAAAALATMTLSGISAAEASTALNRVFLAFIDPSDAMTDALKRNNYESGSAAIKALGLKGAMELVARETGGNVEAMRALFPEVRGLKGALALLADEGKTYAGVAQAITSETEVMGATQRAYNEQSKSFSFQLEVAKNNMNALAIAVGQALLPVMNTLLSTITSMVNFFQDLPGPIQAVAGVLAGLTAIATAVGGAFLLLAPRINAAREAFSDLGNRAPGVTSAISTAGRALGLIGIALSAVSVAAGIYAASQKEAKEATEAFRVAVEQERQGLDGATDAAIRARLAGDGLIGMAAKAGISYKDLTEAVKGNADAFERVTRESQGIVGSLGQQSTAMGGLNTNLNAGKVGASDFGGAVSRMRDALAEATNKVKSQEDATALMMEVTGKTKKELVDLGLATETTGDKIGEAAASIGLTTAAFSKMGIDSEEAAKAFAKSVTSVMEATQKAFVKDFDVVAQFSASNWAKMQKDAESGAGAIVAAENKLADAQQNLINVQERLAEKTKLTASDHQALAKAEDQVTEAAEKLAAAHAKGTDSLGTMSEEIKAFYAESLAEAQAFSAGISRAIELGLDPSVVVRLLQEGPKQAAPLLQEIMSGHGASLVTMMNESEAALAKSGQLAVETARLTQLAVSSKSGQMVVDLKTAMKIAQLEAESGGRLTMEALAFSMNLSYEKVKQVVDDFGIVVPASLTSAGQRGAQGFQEGMSPIAPSADALVRAVDKSVKDFIGPLPPYMNERAVQIATQFKLGTDPMPGDANAVMYLIDNKIRGTMEPLPGFSRKTADDLSTFWKVGLDPMPGDTDSRAQSTARMLHNALDPLPGDTRNISYNMVNAWLTELAKGEGGTSEQTQAWARAMLNVLNPLLKGAGAAPISMEQQDSSDPGWVGNAEGNVYERHDATIAKPGGPMRLWAEPETQGEAYIPLAPAKRRRSQQILGQVAEKFGLNLIPMAFGGVLDELGLPISPTLGEYGDMVGYTAEEDDRYAYNKIREWVIADNERKAREAEAAAQGGGQPYSGGSIGSGWQQITGYLDSVGQPYQITSTYRAGDPGFHGRGKAVDMVGDMAAIFNTLAAGNPVPGINELFYDPMGYFYDEGNRAGGAIGGHDDHVHAATFDYGGILQRGKNVLFNNTGAPERLIPATAMAFGGILPGPNPWENPHWNPGAWAARNSDEWVTGVPAPDEPTQADLGEAPMYQAPWTAPAAAAPVVIAEGAFTFNPSFQGEVSPAVIAEFNRQLREAIREIVMAMRQGVR